MGTTKFMRSPKDDLLERVNLQAHLSRELVEGQKNRHARMLARPLVDKALDELRPLDERIVMLETITNVLTAAVLAR